MKNCESCRWRSDEFTSVCVNDASDHLADFVSADDRCEEWEATQCLTRQQSEEESSGKR